MILFLRLLSESDKAAALQEVCYRARSGGADPRLFEVAPEAFDAVPGKPFAYWVSEAVRETFRRLPAFEGDGRTVKQGLATADDFRFVRGWWEAGETANKWFPFAKGGAYSPFYADVYLMVNWAKDGAKLNAFSGSVIRNPDFYFRPGLTWPLRTQIGLSMRAMPAGGIFGHKGPAALVANDDPDELLPLLALTNSRAFALLVSLQMAFGSYEVGVIQKTPVPPLASHSSSLAPLSRRAWSLKRTLDTANQTSHAFTLPALLQVAGGTLAERAAAWERRVAEIQDELSQIQRQIDDICFDLYGFSEADRAAALAADSAAESPGDEDE